MRSLYLFFLFHSILIQSQESVPLFLKICNSFDKINLTNKIHFIGEYHYQSDNEKVLFTYLKLHNDKGIFPKCLVVERGPSYAYILNKYLAFGDEYLLQLIEPLQSKQTLFHQLYNYNNKLELKNQFNFIGVDYDDYVELTHFTIRDILLTQLKTINNEYYLKINSYNDFLNSEDELMNLLVSFKIKDKPDAWSKSLLNDDLKLISKMVSQDSMKVLNIFGNKLKDVRKILKAYEIPKANKQIYSTKNKDLRDRYMALNLYAEYLKDTSVIMIAQVGSAHIPKSFQKNWSEKNTNSMACLLNNDPDFKQSNNKIISNIIIYKNYNYKTYNYIELSKELFNITFSKMNNCEIYFEKFHNPTVLDNMIFLNNNK